MQLLCGAAVSWLMFVFALGSVQASQYICGNDCVPLLASVPDSGLTSSSMWNADYGAPHGRLNKISNDGGDVWHAHRIDKTYTTGEWIQVQFPQMMRVFKIQTAGRPTILVQWTSKYRVRTSEDCITFTDYKEDGRVKIFDGNTDRNAVVTNTLKNPVKAMCFRIIVEAFRHVPVLRIELIGKKVCSRGYTFWRNSCYALIQEEMTWSDADTFCKGRGGTLINVDNKAENDWVETFLKEKKTVSDVWISLNRLLDQQHWETSPDKLAVYYNWGNQSHHHEGNCVVIIPEYDYKWATMWCNSHRMFICEK